MVQGGKLRGDGRQGRCRTSTSAVLTLGTCKGGLAKSPVNTPATEDGALDCHEGGPLPEDHDHDCIWAATLPSLYFRYLLGAADRLAQADYFLAQKAGVFRFGVLFSAVFFGFGQVKKADLSEDDYLKRLALHHDVMAGGPEVLPRRLLQGILLPTVAADASVQCSNRFGSQLLHKLKGAPKARGRLQRAVAGS